MFWYSAFFIPVAADDDNDCRLGTNPARVKERQTNIPYLFQIQTNGQLREYKYRPAAAAAIKSKSMLIYPYLGCASFRLFRQGVAPVFYFDSRLRLFFSPLTHITQHNTNVLSERI